MSARRACAARAAALLGGVLLDAVCADPARFHPVAGFGRLARAVERHSYRRSRVSGAVHVAVLVAMPATCAAAVDRRLRKALMARSAYFAALTWSVMGARSLHREARAMRVALDAGDVDRARARLPHLCGRDPETLGTAGLVRATIESVAENTSDAVVAPLLWGAFAGPAGLVGYRAVNTLDAMIGHRSDRYLRFGWAAARVDDVANLLPARLTAALAIALAPLVGGCRSAARRARKRDARLHPSPNAGQCEAAFAGALGVRLGGPVVYPYGASERPWLGDGREPTVGDIDRAVQLSQLVGVGALACAAAISCWRRG